MMETSSSHPYSCPKTRRWPPSHLQGRNRAITLPSRAMHYPPAPTHEAYPHEYTDKPGRTDACCVFARGIISASSLFRRPFRHNSEGFSRTEVTLNCVAETERLQKKEGRSREQNCQSELLHCQSGLGAERLISWY